VPDPDPLDLLRDSLRALPGPQSRTPDCLDDDTVAALAAGTLDAAARARALAHLAACARCRHAVASVARALSDPAVAREVTAAERRGRRLPYGLALSAAAAAILLLLAGPRLLDLGRPVHRAPPLTAAVPVPASPVGVVADADTLRWLAVPGADRYRVTVFDAPGAVLYETQLADTVAILPDSLVLVPGRPYLWKVEARTGWDRWSPSELVEFSLAPLRGAPQ